MQKSLTRLEKLTPDMLPSLDISGKRVADWARQHRHAIADWARQATLPEAVINRAGDNWVPLFAIAKAVGGDWPQRATAAMLDYEKNNASIDRGILLLSNLKTLIVSASKTFFSSQELCDLLNAREDWPWGEYAYGDGLNVYKLAKMLKGFGIKPRQEKSAKAANGTRAKVRGYHRQDFERVWTDYKIESETAVD
jgi:hypothetical protein